MLDKQEIALLTKNSIASKAASKEILQNFQPFVANLDVQDAYSLLAKRGRTPWLDQCCQMISSNSYLSGAWLMATACSTAPPLFCKGMISWLGYCSY